MKKIEVKSWEAKDSEGKALKEDTLLVLSVLVNSAKPENIPRGLDNFRLFSRISRAFDKAEIEKVLVLEETDYSFLKKLIEEAIPAQWAFNKERVEAIDAFLNAESE